jgi:hypothetical protein
MSTVNKTMAKRGASFCPFRGSLVAVPAEARLQHMTSPILIALLMYSHYSPSLSSHCREPFRVQQSHFVPRQCIQVLACSNKQSAGRLTIHPACFITPPPCILIRTIPGAR